MEPDVSAGEALGAVVGVVDPMVVVAAEELAVVEVGAAAGPPRVAAVVGLAPGAGDVAALGAARPVAEQQRLALGGVEQAAGASEVEGEAVAAQDGGHDLRGAGEASGLACSDAVALAGEAAGAVSGDQSGADQVGGAEVGLQRGERHGDDDGGGAAAVDRHAGRIDVLEETEPWPVPSAWGRASV